MKRILMGIVAAAAIATALFGVNANKGVSSPSVTSVSPIQEKRQERVCGLGYIEPVTEARGLSFKPGGVIKQCNVQVGSVVKQGDVLMVLEDSEEARLLDAAQRELELAESEQADALAGVNKYEIEAADQELEIAKERQAYAEKEYTRNRTLVEGHTISESEFDAINTAYREACIAVRLAAAKLQHLSNYVTDEHKRVVAKKVDLATCQREVANQQLVNMRLVAPCDGTVLEIMRREGESVSEIIHEPVLLFGDVTKLRVRAEVDDRFVYTLKIGQQAKVYGRTLGSKEFVGNLAYVKEVMGKKTVFNRSSTERRDLDVVQVFIDMPESFRAPAGLRVDVEIRIAPGVSSVD